MNLVTRQTLLVAVQEGCVQTGVALKAAFGGAESLSYPGVGILILETSLLSCVLASLDLSGISINSMPSFSPLHLLSYPALAHNQREGGPMVGPQGLPTALPCQCGMCSRVSLWGTRERKGADRTLSL